MGKPRLSRAGQNQRLSLGSLSRPTGLPQATDHEQHLDRGLLKSSCYRHILAGKGQAARASHRHHVSNQEGGKSATFTS